MTFYEQELGNCLRDGMVIGSPKFTGRACLGNAGERISVPVCSL